MQTGICYVRLKGEIEPGEARVEHDGRSRFIGEIVKKGRPYPVLAVEYLERPAGAVTLYHIPVDDNTIMWLPADLFVFARD